MTDCSTIESRLWTANPSSKQKLHMQSVPPHPMPVCESANMAATSLPQLEYDIHPRILKIAKKGYLSDMQLETAAYASQAITKQYSGKAFFMGDATGIGKTRSAISTILDRAAKVREVLGPDSKFRVLWVSCRSDLENDVKETLRLLETHSSDGVYLKWHSMTSLLYSATNEPLSKRRKKQSSESNGDMFGDFAFVTYGSLRRGIVSSDITNAITLNGAIDWLNQASESIIVFDEAHISKTPRSASHEAVCKLQRNVARSGVIYCTATPASDITNISYMERLGLFGDWIESPFSTHMECQRHLRKGGVSALELVALHLKSRGLYVSRILSLPDSAPPIHGGPIRVRLTPAQRDLYDEYCSLWTNQTGIPNTVLTTTPGIFTSMRQSFFLKLLTSFKAQAILGDIKDALSDGWAVVISIQSTGKGTDTTSCTDILKNCNIPMSTQKELPHDPLDTLILGLHETDGVGPVAEITGRKSRIEFDAEGKIIQVSRTAKQVKTEVQRFQQGQINVAILSAAGGTGISLHASEQSPKRRLHILLELPWSSETLVQQCGRTHRTGEIIPPLYRVVSADVPVDWRIAQTVSKRLENLGALSRGDRRHQQVHPDIENTMLTPVIMHRAGFEILMRESHERFNQLLLHEMYGLLCKHPITRLDARIVLHVGNGWNHDAIQHKISERLAQLLTDIDSCEVLAECETDHNRAYMQNKLRILTQSFITVFKAAQILLPEEDCDADQNRQWSIKTHHSFSKRKREMARMIWLCARTPSSSNRFSSILDDVLEIIITNVLDDGWNHPPSHVIKYLKKAGIPRINLIKGSPDTSFSPRFSAVPVDVQTTFWTAIKRATEYVNNSCMTNSKRDTKQLIPRGATGIINHCFPNGVMPGCQARCLSMVHKVSPPGHVLIEVDVYPLQNPAIVSDTAFHEAIQRRSDCNHSTSSRVIGLYYSQGSQAIRVVIEHQHTPGERAVAWDVEIYAAGVVDPISKVTQENWENWKNEYLSDIASCISVETLKTQWQKEGKIQDKRRKTRCAKSRIIVEVVTAKHALYEWENTSGVLVRGEPPFLPEPIIGVVTSTKRFH